MARRLLERGVRVVQVWQGKAQPWDNHDNIVRNHGNLARETDQPIAALLADLKGRGLLKDTLVLWAGEFGRTPTALGSDGRAHNPETFTVWLAGGGVKAGLSYGATDDYGYYSVEKKVHFHDLHATMLHLLGIDHKRMTYPYQGLDARLTGVAGNIVEKILA